MVHGKHKTSSQVSPPASEGTETTGPTGPGSRPSPATWDPPARGEVARSSSPSRASSLCSSPAATLDLACGPWAAPLRGGPWSPVIPVELVPKLAGGDTQAHAPTAHFTQAACSSPASAPYS